MHEAVAKKSILRRGWIPACAGMTGGRGALWTAIVLSVRLAAIVAGVLLVIALPLAQWLAFSNWRWKFLV